MSKNDMDEPKPEQIPDLTMPLRAEYPDYGMPDHRPHVPSVTLPTSGAQCGTMKPAYGWKEDEIMATVAPQQKDKPMRYFIFSFLWKTPQMGDWNCGDDLFAGNGIPALYEHAHAQPEKWCVTNVSEISKEEYDAAEARGIIG